MKHWDEESRAEYEAAAEQAWNSGRNDRERTARFLKIVRDAEQAQRSWAHDVLVASEWDGIWRRLKQHHRTARPITISFAGAQQSVPRVGGIARRVDGVTRYEQVPFADMTRDELIDKEREYDATSFAARRNKHLVRTMRSLIDSGIECVTARQAAEQRGIDIDEFVAGAA